MSDKWDGSDGSQGISRRDFIKIAAAAGLLAGCSPTQQSPATLVPTVAPTAALAPTDTPQPLQKVPGRIVRARHAGVWEGETLAAEALRQMLDVSIAKLTGIDDPGAVWAALFDSGERIAIKVNTVRDGIYWTHVPLVMAVTKRLQEVGVPAEQIVVFDRTTTELRTAGYPLNKDGPGVRCCGTDGSYTGGWRIMDTNIRLSNALLDCDALINIPLLKAHVLSGLSFALKNHYGTLNNPENFHIRIGQAMAELNALELIRDRTRLIVGDALTICTTYDWRDAVAGDSILMSFDPVAHDLAGLQVLAQAMDAEGVDRTAATNMGSRCLREAAELGLGVGDPNSIEWLELNLG